MMSSEASYSGRMTYNKQEEEQNPFRKLTNQNVEGKKMNEVNAMDLQSVYTDDKNHPNPLETSSQKQSMKDRKRTFHKMEKMNQ